MRVHAGERRLATDQRQRLALRHDLAGSGEPLEDRLHEGHVLGVIHRQTVLRAIEAVWQRPGADLELPRMLLDVERDELRAVARLAALPRALESGARDDL